MDNFPHRTLVLAAVAAVLTLVFGTACHSAAAGVLTTPVAAQASPAVASPSPAAAPSPSPSTEPPAAPPATPPAAALPAPAPGAPPATAAVAFSGLPPGVYPVHLHTICNGRQNFHLAYLPELAVGGGGGGVIVVPTRDFNRGWCVIVYANRFATAVLAVRPI